MQLKASAQNKNAWRGAAVRHICHKSTANVTLPEKKCVTEVTGDLICISARALLVLPPQRTGHSAMTSLPLEFELGKSLWGYYITTCIFTYASKLPRNAANDYKFIPPQQTQRGQE